jgi:hypothetical protein
MNLDFDSIVTKGAGIAGGLLSLRFVQGTWTQKIVMAAGGAVVSLYATPWAAQKTGLPEGLTGFLLGLFGMAVCAKAWEAIQVIPLIETWGKATDWLFKRPPGA